MAVFKPGIWCERKRIFGGRCDASLSQSLAKCVRLGVNQLGLPIELQGQLAGRHKLQYQRLPSRQRFGRVNRLAIPKHPVLREKAETGFSQQVGWDSLGAHQFDFTLRGGDDHRPGAHQPNGAVKKKLEMIRCRRNAVLFGWLIPNPRKEL